MSAKDDLDKYINGLWEVGITNLLSALELYMQERFYNEFKQRIEMEDANYTFEWKMRWIAEFKKFVEEYLKD